MHMTDLGSSDLERLRDFLRARRVTRVKVQERRSAGIDFVLYVPGDSVSLRVGHHQTSVRQMDRLRADIKSRLNLDVDWIITQDDRVAALEAALLAALEARFPVTFTTVSVSALQLSPVWVWFETTPGADNRPSEEVLNKMAAHIFGAFELEPPVALYVDSSDLPTSPMILRRLKTNSPTTSESLAERLRKDRVMIPNLEWLQTKLDTLRRKGLIARAEDGTYAMTEEGLRIVPHGRSRSSSDIERALALSRKRW